MTGTLSPCQSKVREEFHEFLSGSGRHFILTGGPGRGKSYLTKVLIDDYNAFKRGGLVYITATTNKAAKVLGDFVGQEASTIHSLLGLRVRNDFKTGKTILSKSPDSEVIYNALIVMDEVSMADDDLWKIVDECTCDCRFLLVGDKDQLAPIMQSRPPIFYKQYPIGELLTVMRQKEGSGIVKVSDQLRHTIQTGLFQPITPNGVDVIQVSGEEFQSLVDEKFTKDVEPDRYKIICWKNDSVRAYNDYIRGRYYDSDVFTPGEVVVTNQPIFDKQGTVYSTDELVTIMSATPDVQQGVPGHWYELSRNIKVFQADRQEDVKHLLAALAKSAKDGGGWVSYFAAKDFFADLRAVHSCTSHKSQGSSYDEVFIDLSDFGDCRQWEQVARMLYVAVTRARHKVYLYGSLPAKYTNFHHKVS